VAKFLNPGSINKGKFFPGFPKLGRKGDLKKWANLGNGKLGVPGGKNFKKFI